MQFIAGVLRLSPSFILAAVFASSANFCARIRPLRSRRSRKTRPDSNSTATGIPIPVPIVRPLWDGWAGLDDDLSGVGVGESVDSDRLGDVEKGSELEDVARCEDEEAGVGAFWSAVFSASDLEDGEAGDEEGVGVKMTCPTTPFPTSKSGPLQHPGSSREAVSCPPQHQLSE